MLRKDQVMKPPPWHATSIVWEMLIHNSGTRHLYQRRYRSTADGQEQEEEEIKLSKHLVNGVTDVPQNTVLFQNNRVDLPDKHL